MIQVFRLMGMPDKVIAFDELPERLLKGFEMCRADGFPRHWKQWLGKRDLITKVPPEKDPLTGLVRTFEPIIESDSFFYMVDWTLNPVMEKWKEVCDFVRQHVDKEVRLADKLDDMAKPLAANKADGVTLEPEDVVIIPIPIEYQEKNLGLVNAAGQELKKTKEDPSILKCVEPGCTSEFEGTYARNAMRMHVAKKHKKVSVAA